MSVSNDLILSGGLLSDVGVIDTRFLSVIDPADKAMSLTTVKVLERASFEEGILLSRDGASFIVTENATYVFDNPNDVAILDDGGVRSEFINYGVVEKTNYDSVVNIDTFLENYGLVSSAGGDLQFTGGSDHYGVFSTEIDGKISLRDGIHNLFLESYIIGSGILEISGSAESLSRSNVFLNDNAKVLQTGGDSVWDTGLNVTNDYSIFQLDDGIMTFFGSTGEMSVSQFIINGGKLFVPAELTIRRGIHQTDGLFSTSGVSTVYFTYQIDGGEQSGSGRTYVEDSFLWNEGLLSGLGTTIFNNYAEWATAGRKHIDERFVENYGTIDWFDGHLYGSRGTMFLNMENATINAGNVDWLRTEGSALLRNFGNITKLDMVFVNDDGYCSSPRLHGIPNDWSDSTNFISTDDSTLEINDGIFTVMGIRDTRFENGLSFAAHVRVHTTAPGWGTSTGYIYQGKISYSEYVELEFRQRYVWLASNTHRYDERLTLRVSTTEGNSARTYTFSGVAANTFRHYTVVRQESDFHFYREGQPQTSISLGGTFPRTENNTFLFGDYSADFEIDNIRVYERALSEGEANNLRSFESPGADLMSSSVVSHGLVGFYTFNDPQDLFFALADCETISPEGSVNWRYARKRIEWIVENRATIRAENGSVEFLGGGFSDGRLSALETGTFIFGRERVTLAGVIDTARAIVIDSGDHEIRTDMNVLILQTGGTLTLTPPAECPPEGEYDLTAPRIILDGGELRVPRPLDPKKNCYFLKELIFKSGLLTVQGDLTILDKFHQDAGLAVVDGALTARTEYVKNGGILEGVGVLTSTHNFDWNGGILRGSGGSIVFYKNVTISTNHTKTLSHRSVLLQPGTILDWQDGMWNLYGGPVFDNYGTIMFNRDNLTLENENPLEPPPVLKNYHHIIINSNEAFIYLYIDNSADAEIHLLRGKNYMMNGGTLRGYLYTYANASLIFPALGGEGQNARVYFTENSWLVGQGEVLFDGSDIDARGIFNMTGDDARIIARGGTVWFRDSAKIASTAPFIIDGAFVDFSGANHEVTNVIVLNGTLYTDAALTVSLNLEVYNGLVSLDGAGDLTITEGQFIFKGGEIGGMNDIVVLEDVYSVWSCLTPTKGGNFIGYGSNTFMGTLNIEGACPKTWTRRTFFLHGETFWSGGYIEATEAGTLSVEQTGSLHSLDVNSISMDGNFNNKGKVLAYDSLNVTSRLVASVGSRFEAFNGTSRFFAGGMLPGTIFLDHNTELIFMALAFHMDHTARFIGNGTIIFVNAMSTFLGIVEDMEVIILGGTTQFRAPAKINNCRSQLLVLAGTVSFARSETHNKIEVCVFNIYGGTLTHTFALELTVFDLFSIYGGSYDISGSMVSGADGVFLFIGGQILGFGSTFVSGYSQWNCTIFRGQDSAGQSVFDCHVDIADYCTKQVFDQRRLIFLRTSSWSHGYIHLTNRAVMDCRGRFSVNQANIVKDTRPQPDHRSQLIVRADLDVMFDLEVAAYFVNMNRTAIFENTTLLLIGGGNFEGDVFGQVNSWADFQQGEFLVAPGSEFTGDVNVRLSGTAITTMRGIVSTHGSIFIESGVLNLHFQTEWAPHVVLYIYDGLVQARREIFTTPLVTVSSIVATGGELFVTDDANFKLTGFLNISDNGFLKGGEFSIFNISVFNFHSGLVDGFRDTVYVDHLWNWWDGVLRGQDCVISPIQEFYISAPNNKILQQRFINVRGQALWTEGSLIMTQNARFITNHGGTTIIDFADPYVIQANSNNELFINEGLFRFLNSSALLTFNAGTRFFGKSIVEGSEVRFITRIHHFNRAFEVLFGGFVNIIGNTVTFHDLSVLTLSGDFTINSGTVTMRGLVKSNSTGFFSINDGTVTLTSTLFFDSDFFAPAAIHGGSVTVALFFNTII
ncbi:hypothetical protein GEMRC1_012174 [Eukaryota sp. GEM-RC1]